MKYYLNTFFISVLCFCWISNHASAQIKVIPDPPPILLTQGVNHAIMSPTEVDGRVGAQPTDKTFALSIHPTSLSLKQAWGAATPQDTNFEEKGWVLGAVEQGTKDPFFRPIFSARLPRGVNFVKYGKHLTVLENGEYIIDQIRALASASEMRQSILLRSIMQAAQKGSPEAQNFMGVIYEYAMYGTQRNITLATHFYEAAASKDYPPAIYNLGLVAYYGKNASQANPDVDTGESSRALFTKAAVLAKGADNFRLCGMASLINYQFSKMDLANKFAANCESPLSNLAKVNSTSMTTPEKIRSLRFFAATGANDAFPLLEKVAKEAVGKDENYPYCTWHIFNEYFGRTASSGKAMNISAQKCVENYYKYEPKTPLVTLKESKAVTSVIAGVNSEVVHFKEQRELSRVHYSWAVPYLPFNIVESDLFYPLMSKAARDSPVLAHQREMLN